MVRRVLVVLHLLGLVKRRTLILRIVCLVLRLLQLLILKLLFLLLLLLLMLVVLLLLLLLLLLPLMLHSRRFRDAALGKRVSRFFGLWHRLRARLHLHLAKPFELRASVRQAFGRLRLRLELSERLRLSLVLRLQLTRRESNSRLRRELFRWRGENCRSCGGNNRSGDRIQSRSSGGVFRHWLKADRKGRTRNHRRHRGANSTSRGHGRNRGLDRGRCGSDTIGTTQSRNRNKSCGRRHDRRAHLVIVLEVPEICHWL